MIIFTKHAKDKFNILKKHKFIVSEEQVLKTIQKPDLIDTSRLPLFIAQRRIDKTHILRVVYKQEEANKKVITFYPGRINQYEK